MRRIVHLFLLFCLPLYGFAMQGGLPSGSGKVTLAHEFKHEAGVHHHHDEDGSIHYDDSDESLAHCQEQPSSPQPAGLAQALPGMMAAPARTVPCADIASTVPEPFLDGPHRPPAPSLGHAAGGMPHA